MDLPAYSLMHDACQSDRLRQRRSTPCRRVLDRLLNFIRCRVLLRSILNAPASLAAGLGAPARDPHRIFRSRDVSDAIPCVAVPEAGPSIDLLHGRSASWNIGGVGRFPHHIRGKACSKCSTVLDSGWPCVRRFQRPNVVSGPPKPRQLQGFLIWIKAAEQNTHILPP
jgi:hypothetical protein